jgi:6-phosphogluconolactonase
VTRRVRIFPDLDRASRALARHVADRAREAVARRGRFTIVLSGGTTPIPLFRCLAELPARAVPWSSTEVYFGDERCVSPRSTRSNYAAARRLLLSKVAIPRGQVHRIPGELRPPSAAAARYDTLLRRIPRSRGDPRFDLVLLGIGPDGHTASLFPGDTALSERRRLVLPVNAPDLPPHVPRITLTLPALTSSRETCFLVAGADKAPVLARVLASRTSARSWLPAARVRSPLVTWYVDRAAASELTQRAGTS